MRQTERYRAVFEKEIKEVKVSRSVSKFYEIAGTLVPTFVIVFLILAFVFRVASVSGSSMIPTLSNGDSVLISNVKQDYNYGDIVVISQPNNLNTNLNANIIKRIIGVSGDVVDVDYSKGIVLVNGKELDELYVNTPTTRMFDDNLKFPLTVPKGHVFVMGDNRNSSLDSRSKKIGFIDERYIYGKAYFRLLPLNEWRIYNDK